MTTRPDDQGAIAVVVAVFAVVLFGFGALVVDLGVVRTTRVEAQSAVDSAALAGAAELYDDADSTPVPEAVDEVKRYAAANFGTPSSSWATCSTPLPSGWTSAGSGTSCIAFDDAVRPSQVRVRLPSRAVAAAFGGVVAYDGTEVSAAAVAQALDSSVRKCSLCVVAGAGSNGFVDVDGVVNVDGNGSLLANDGDVSASGSITVSGGGSIGFAESPNPAPPSVRYSPQPITLGPADPFVTAPMPSTNSVESAKQSCDSAGDLQANTIYKHVSVDGPCVLPAGTVFISGKLTFKKNASGRSLSGVGTTLYFTCQPQGQGNDSDSGNDEDGGSDPSLNVCVNGRAGGSLSVPSDVTVRLVSSAFGGLAVLYDPTNSAKMTVDGTLDVDNASIYRRRGSASVGAAGRLDVTNGYVSLGGLTVKPGGRTDVSTSGVGSTPGPPRLALVD